MNKLQLGNVTVYSRVKNEITYCVVKEEELDLLNSYQFNEVFIGEYDSKMFSELFNEGTNKPSGGLWTSPMDKEHISQFGKFAYDERYILRNMDNEKKRVPFHRVYPTSDKPHLLVSYASIEALAEMTGTRLGLSGYAIPYALLARHFASITLLDNCNGWDIDSTVWFTPASYTMGQLQYASRDKIVCTETTDEDIEHLDYWLGEVEKQLETVYSNPESLRSEENLRPIRSIFDRVCFPHGDKPDSVPELFPFEKEHTKENRYFI